MLRKTEELQELSSAEQLKITEELHGEIDRLSKKLRQAIVLRYMEGHPQDTAAAIAGCPQGTLAWRAKKGLDRLRRQMLRRHKSLSGLILISLMGQEAMAAVPETLLASLSAVSASTAGAVIGVTGSHVTVLAEGVMKMMLWEKIKTVAAALILMGIIGVSVPVLMHAVNNEDETPKKTGDVRKPLEKELKAAQPITGKNAARLTLLKTLKTIPAFLEPRESYNQKTKKTKTFRPFNTLHSVALSPDNKLAVGGYSDKTAKVWDVKSGKIRAVLEGHPEEVWAVDFSPDGKYIATGSFRGNKIFLWNSADGTKKLTLRLPGEPDIGSPEENAWLREKLLDPEFRDKHTEPGSDGVLRLTKKFKTNGTYALRFTPDGKRLISANKDHFLRIWSMPDGKQLQACELKTGIFNLSLTQDSRIVAGGDFMGTAKLWDVETGKELRTFRLPEKYKDHGFSEVCISPDGTYLAIGIEGEQFSGNILLYDLRKKGDTSYSVLTGLRGHGPSVLMFTPDSKAVLGGGDDFPLYIWHTASGRRKGAVNVGLGENDVLSAAFSADGRYLVGTGHLQLEIWGLPE